MPINVGWKQEGRELGKSKATLISVQAHQQLHILQRQPQTPPHLLEKVLLNTGAGASHVCQPPIAKGCL